MNHSEQHLRQILPSRADKTRQAAFEDTPSTVVHLLQHNGALTLEEQHEEPAQRADRSAQGTSRRMSDQRTICRAEVVAWGKTCRSCPPVDGGNSATSALVDDLQHFTALY